MYNCIKYLKSKGVKEDCQVSDKNPKYLYVCILKVLGCFEHDYAGLSAF